MLFSIVIPVYNSEKYIINTLESVREQTLKDYEIIVVNDGSNDRSEELIKKYMEEHPELRISYRGLSCNGGVSTARNVGINMSVGDYISFLDADDLWYENKLQETCKAINEQPGHEIYWHWEKRISNCRTRLIKYRRVNNKEPYRDLLFYGNCLSTSATTIKRTFAVRTSGFDTSLRDGEEDYDFWLKCAKLGGRFYLIKKPLSCYIERNGSLSSRHIEHYEAGVAMVEKHFSHMLNTEDDKERIERKRIVSKAYLYYGLGRALYADNDRKMAVEYYKRSIGMYPFHFKPYIALLLAYLQNKSSGDNK